MAGLAAGIEFGGTKCLGVVLDETGKVLRSYRRPTPRHADDLMRTVLDVATALEPWDTLGLGAGGLVDIDGVLRFAPNVGRINLFPLGERISERLGRFVPIDNDGTLAAVAEWHFGVGVGIDDMVLLTLGTGIGCGIVAGGKLQRGANGLAGEPGHMVIDPSGPMCVCGQRGCWERFASGSGLTYLSGGRRGEDVNAAARRGEADAVDVFDRFAWWLALGIVNLVNFIDPGLIVIGGGLVEAHDLYLGATRQYVQELRYASASRPPVRIEAAKLGEQAGAIGAALIGVERAVPIS